MGANSGKTLGCFSNVGSLNTNNLSSQMQQQAIYGGNQFRTQPQFPGAFQQGSLGLKRPGSDFCADNTPNLLDDANFFNFHQPMLRGEEAFDEFPTGIPASLE